MKSQTLALIAASLTLSACAASGVSPEVAVANAEAEGAKAGAVAEPAANLVKKADGTYPSPGEIVAAAPAEDWVKIAPEDLLVMDLAPDAKGKARRVIIQLIPAPISTGWTGNIRKLAAAHWWDGTAVVRVQDNYVTQWGDPTEEKALPEGLVATNATDYVTPAAAGMIKTVWNWKGRESSPYWLTPTNIDVILDAEKKPDFSDSYSLDRGFFQGFPIGLDQVYSSEDPPSVWPSKLWPLHCYGMVGVARGQTPDAGTGAELYTVIGHAPRHLDRNIALVGRVIAGMEHLSSLPRGTGNLGFYETEEERTVITSVRLASELESDKPFPTYQYLSTESASFAAYADARANRRDPFFLTPAGGADICNIPVPIRTAP